MRFEVNLTPKDFKAFTALIQRGGGTDPGISSRKRYRFAAVWFGLVIFFAILLSIPGFGFEIDLFSAAVSLVFFIAILLALVGKAQQRMMPAEDGTVLGRHVYEFSGDGVRSFSKHTENLVRWSGVRGLNETKTHLFVMVDRNAALILPKRFIETDDQLESLKSLVNSRIEPVS